jgi:voltage-gated potassium channel Kch
MLINIAVAALLAVLTTVLHASAMVFAWQGLRLSRRRWVGASALQRIAVVASLVLIMLLTTVLESTLWALTYVVIGALSDFGEALYFSTVTYTTLGYGDIVVGEEWRLLASLEAANGIIMFGWTTALIMAAVHHVYITHPAVREEHSDV